MHIENDEDTPLPPGVVEEITAIWATKDLGRYMENPDCQTVEDWPGWEGFSLKRCTYEASSTNATVIMLNPSRDLLINWVIASCVIKYGDGDEQKLIQCSKALLKWIHDQSGSQFAIAGLVDEEEGAYSFRDGLAVKLEWTPPKWTHPISQKYQDASLDRTYPIIKCGNKARIASTQRTWFANYEQEYLQRPPTDTTGEKYLEIIRECYQDAWTRANDPGLPETVGKYRNDLIAAYHFQ